MNSLRCHLQWMNSSYPLQPIHAKNIVTIPLHFHLIKRNFFCWGKNTSHKSANSLFVTFCLFTWCLKISFSQKYIGYPVNAMLHDKEILISKNKMNVKVEQLYPAFGQLVDKQLTNLLIPNCDWSVVIMPHPQPKSATKCRQSKNTLY